MPKVHRCDTKLFDKDLTGQVIIITGANSGIGFEATKQLASQKATVVMACRNEAKAKKAIEDLGLPDNTVYLPLDLSDLASVREFAKKFTESYDRLDVLVNNAGVMACPFDKTKDGFEFQFGCNHLAHFLLFNLLVPTLLKTAEDTGKPSRFIAISSAAAEHFVDNPLSDIDFDDLMFETRKYEPGVAYGQSKLANYLHALEAAKKYDPSKLMSFSVHPGWVRSNLDAHMIPQNFMGNMLRNAIMLTGKMIKVEDGAQTTLHCVLNDIEKMENGAFYAQNGPFKNKKAKKGGWPMVLPNKNATPEKAAKLWEVSEKLVGI